MPPVEEWDSFPFDGEMAPRALRPPVEREERRHGEGGVECRACQRPDDEYVWTTERWRLYPVGPTGLPLVLILEPREHFSSPADLPEELAAEQGVLLSRIERAINSIGDFGRVHVCRWGDGSEHFHLWALARPLGMMQGRGAMLAFWDDVLPPLPDDLQREHLRVVATAMAEGGGEATVRDGVA